MPTKPVPEAKEVSPPEPALPGHGATFEALKALAAPTPATEVKTRPGKGSSGALSYVDARFVQDRFDHSVGPWNWARRHFVDQNGNVGCEVGVLISYGGATEPQWVWKSDIGTESTIESIKGQYSDSFKRAAVNWGVARDLYDEKSEARGGGASAPTFRPSPSSGPAGAGVAAPSTRAAHSDPNPDPEWACPIHGTRRVVPAGVSKNGRSYPAFAVCSERECDEKPPRRSRQQGKRPTPAGTEFVGMMEE